MSPELAPCRDKEDGSRLRYVYRVDKGEWSTPTRARRIAVSDVSEGLEPGVHIFEVMAIDSQRAVSNIKGIEFTK